MFCSHATFRSCFGKCVVSSHADFVVLCFWDIQMSMFWLTSAQHHLYVSSCFSGLHAEQIHFSSRNVFSLSMFFKVSPSVPYSVEDHVRSVEILQVFSLVNAPSLKQHRKRLISVSTRECSSFVLMVEPKCFSRFIAQLFCSCASVAHHCWGSPPVGVLPGIV